MPSVDQGAPRIHTAQGQKARQEQAQAHIQRY